MITNTQMFIILLKFHVQLASSKRKVFANVIHLLVSITSSVILMIRLYCVLLIVGYLLQLITILTLITFPYIVHSTTAYLTHHISTSPLLTHNVSLTDLVSCVDTVNKVSVLSSVHSHCYQCSNSTSCSSVVPIMQLLESYWLGDASLFYNLTVSLFVKDSLIHLFCRQILLVLTMKYTFHTDTKSFHTSLRMFISLANLDFGYSSMFLQWYG